MDKYAIATIFAFLLIFILIWSSNCTDEMSEINSKPKNPQMAECWEAHQRVKDLGMNCFGNDDMCMCGKEY